MHIGNQEDLHFLKEYYSRYGGFWVYPDMLDYCYLVNPYFNRSKIIDEMQENFRVLVSEYPAGMAVNSQLASDCWNIKQEYIIPGNGAAELIKALMENLQGKVGVIRPTFEEYPNRLSDERVVAFVPNNESFRYNADDLIQFFGENKVENLLLINPDNPSGNFIPVDGMLCTPCVNNILGTGNSIFRANLRSFGVSHNSLNKNTLKHWSTLRCVDDYMFFCLLREMSA